GELLRLVAGRGAERARPARPSVAAQLRTRTTSRLPALEGRPRRASAGRTRDTGRLRTTGPAGGTPGRERGDPRAVAAVPAAARRGRPPGEEGPDAQTDHRDGRRPSGDAARLAA